MIKAVKTGTGNVFSRILGHLNQTPNQLNGNVRCYRITVSQYFDYFEKDK